MPLSPVFDPTSAPRRLLAPDQAMLLRAFGQDAALSAAVERIGPCRLRGDDGLEPYAALLRAITGQQLHGRAAQAIFGRLCARHGGSIPDPEALLMETMDDLRACGLSRPKIVAMQGVARARLAGVVPDRAEAQLLEDEAIIGRLITLRGIGRWTCEMLLMFTLGRPDVLPIDDLGVREGWRRVRGYDAPPKPRILGIETARFSPCRSALSWYLWRIAEEGKSLEAANPLTG